jgi:phenylpyruvate tautomerase PptA (4-oxalocrotonate tautomerase family)
LYERGNVWPIQKKFTEERPMPFVNIRLYEGHGKERKDELAKRVTEAVQAVWVVFEEVPPTDWYAAGAPGQPVKR